MRRGELWYSPPGVRNLLAIGSGDQDRDDQQQWARVEQVEALVRVALDL